MQSISGSVAYPTSLPSVGTGMNSTSGQANAGTPFAVLPSPLSQLAARTGGASLANSPSLGAQTVSTLLQTQEMNQLQARGGLNLMQGLEAEEAAENEVARFLNVRKKAKKTIKTAEADQNAATLRHRDEEEETPLDEEGRRDSEAVL
ncbi:MAG: hypothetical protein P4M13_10915 [Alphaproteobacteria bacterium]|nr:hypothetical protein [Alphaproteobacteria bacterium]